MSDEYSYRDARLSLWQAAVDAYVRAPKEPTGKTTTADAPVVAAPSTEDATMVNLMLPVHMVAHAIKAVGKPFDWLVHEVKKGILDVKAQFDPLEDCANAAAHFLWAEVEGNVQDSKLYADELQKSVCDAPGWAECLTTYLAYKALLENPVYRRIRT